LVPTEGETLAPNLTRAAKNFFVLSIKVSGFDDCPLNSPRPVTLLSEGVEGRTLCVGGTETEREGEEVE
jgi:hypothetical protein